MPQGPVQPRILLPTGHKMRWLPTREKLATDPRFARLAGFLFSRPWLWALNRRAVARGVACGLLVGVIPLPTQMVLAAVLAGAAHGHVPAAIAATWLTNPITALPIWWVALQLGSLATGVPLTLPDIDWFSVAAVWGWMKELGQPLAIGLCMAAALLSAAGYATTMVLWRLVIVRRYRGRHAGPAALRRRAVRAAGRPPSPRS
ncbi:DUF2062 domain-containing protein [Quisquiliibacterium transsilvanicum]|uniref:DUF2062 domain-containing protein n=1 Tax=Quisquiliibacterium transsilvanicum TaxID=1549638 RepID=A0A7W8HE82_9BURK|nr:DUF2062 domain-containing protein [Quisquiliibacterium transsilvanicum]MBB5270346.1 hypothetical protein [Quisquiliibacterium transsilvanicum]